MPNKPKGDAIPSCFILVLFAIFWGRRCILCNMLRKLSFCILSLVPLFSGAQVDCPLPSEFCGIGTVWDEPTQTCIVALPTDSNFDGCVQLEDLLDLLASYGGCATEEPSWECGDLLMYQGHGYLTVQAGGGVLVCREPCGC